MTERTLCLEDNNLSRAWARAFLETFTPGMNKISPLIVTVTGFNDGQLSEIEQVKQALNESLRKNGKSLIRTTANTIFPRSLWNPAKERTCLYERYLKILPRLKRLDSHNRYDLYFGRLIAFGSDRNKPVNPYNQLEHIISTYLNDNHRGSALQAAIFDPMVDHTNQRQRGFPCLQQVGFIACHQRRELTVLGFYPTQYIFERAYGNYLGLCDLGHFMAYEMGLHLTQMTCVIGVAELGITKKDVADLAQKVKQILAEAV